MRKRREQVQQLYEKVYRAHVKAARRFGQENKATTKDFSLQRSDLVHMRKTAIELLEEALDIGRACWQQMREEASLGDDGDDDE